MVSLIVSYKDIYMTSFMVHCMESLEDVTAHGNIDSLFDVISLRQ